MVKMTAKYFSSSPRFIASPFIFTQTYTWNFLKDRSSSEKELCHSAWWFVLIWVTESTCGSALLWWHAIIICSPYAVMIICTQKNLCTDKQILILFISLLYETEVIFILIVDFILIFISQSESISQKWFKEHFHKFSKYYQFSECCLWLFLCISVKACNQTVNDGHLPLSLHLKVDMDCTIFIDY